ncbi:MAG: hypothetical protein FGM14_12705 [Flavobacteriales bacterium]|nr:hypothetical protein [Flavobacteriales bacterium]
MSQKFENLTGIIEAKAFFPKYSLEFTYLSNEFDRQASLLPIAMTCFCDIPYELSHEHRKRYGNHAIVMNEKWKISKKLNPVMYIQPESYITDVFAGFVNKAIGFSSIIEDERNDINVAKSLGYVTRQLTRLQYFIKQFENKEEITIEYAGKIRRFEKRRFYDEREWRYVPSPDDFFFLPLDIQDYDDLKKLNEANERLIQYPLTFEYEDINYVIVQNESELIEFIEKFGEEKFEIRLSK